MCTLSLFKTDDGYKVFINRDERHDRPVERPPQILCDQHGVYGPVDPVSNGTWVAYNDRGYWGCLLNGYLEEEGHDYSGYKSRGGVLLEILSQDDPLLYIDQLDVSNYPSFRLVIGSYEAHKLFVWDGSEYKEQDFHASYNGHAYFLSSSSWNQDEVIRIRKGLFENWVAQNEAPNGAMPDFHFSREPDMQSAPMMHRSYSRTQSITALNVSKLGVKMDYQRFESAVTALAEAY